MLDESMIGYLLRLAECNGFASLCDLDFLVSPQNCGGSRVKVESLLGGLSLSATRGQVTYFRNLQIPDCGGVDSKCWNGRRPRYCPICLAQAPYWRAVWDLTLMAACPAHRVALRDSCPGCHRALTWKRRHVSECDCGHTLTKVEPEHASDESVAIGAYLAYAMSPKAASSLRYRQPDVQALSLVDLFDLCVQFGTYLSPKGTKPTKVANLYDVSVALGVANGAGQVLIDWPNGFFGLLREIGNRAAIDGKSSRLSARFGYFYTALYRRFGASQFDFLRREFETFVGREWVGQLAGRNRRMSLATRREHAWLPITVAAKLLRVGRDTVRALIEEGRLEGQTHVSPAGRTWGTVSKLSVEQLRNAGAQRMTLTEVRGVLGISRKHAYALIRSGMMKAIRGPSVDGSAVWQFDRQEIAELGEQLSNPIPTCHTHSQWRNNERERSRGRHPYGIEFV
ncbi:hypothetical protein PI93_000075 [Pandoraea fibrosis]|uniref:TniQ domain-containing protein n=2 Tax=Pandoraea fibrosis TaxID=1891094 RepID=A0ABX6HK21_9BURK|nr:hypothetical protein PJ20_000075 [Pandoraea fibrosis]QHF11221.1 hypothetical protein PI93_000075 [Pandoraea fibrosis]